VSPELLTEVLDGLDRFEFTFRGRIPRRFHGGDPRRDEFELNLGEVRFTEDDFLRLSAFFEGINLKWGTEVTYGVYLSPEHNGDMILDVRSAPDTTAAPR
jgi:hypothetical protein